MQINYTSMKINCVQEDVYRSYAPFHLRNLDILRFWYSRRSCKQALPWLLSRKNLSAMQETWVQSLGGEDSPGEGKSYPLQYSCLENSMDLVVGSQRVGHNWATELNWTELMERGLLWPQGLLSKTAANTEHALSRELLPRPEHKFALLHQVPLIQPLVSSVSTTRFPSTECILLSSASSGISILVISTAPQRHGHMTHSFVTWNINTFSLFAAEVTATRSCQSVHKVSPWLWQILLGNQK